MHHSNDNQPGLSFLSVCSGIEAASVAWSPLGWTPVAFGEIDKAASALLAYRYPDVPNLGDFTKIKVRTLPRVDILCGGTPCQAFSVAGARRGLDDARGNLSLAFVGLAHELADHNGLRNAVWENVPGVLTMADNAFGCFLGGLVGADGPFVPVEPKPADRKSTRWWRWSANDKCHAVRWPKHGMVSGPKGRAAWAVKDAQYFGLAQRRERVLVVADFGIGADPAAVLFERVSVPWNPPARGEAREGVAGATAPSLTASGRGVERTGESRGQDPVVAVAYAPEIARCVATREGSSQDYETTTMLAVSVTGEIAHTLKAEGADASEDGTGRGTPIVAFNNTGQGWWNEAETAATVRKGDDNGGGGARESTIVAQTVALRGREGGATAELGGQVATALRASSGGGDKPHVLTSAVRRLTPRECERLQGFQWQCSQAYPGAWQDEAGRWWSPDYTRIPVKQYAKPKFTKNRPPDMWEEIDGKWWLMSADGPSYKQLGNSWAVPKFRWLGERIQRLMPPLAANDNLPAPQVAGTTTNKEAARAA